MQKTLPTAPKSKVTTARASSESSKDAGQTTPNLWQTIGHHRFEHLTIEKHVLCLDSGNYRQKRDDDLGMREDVGLVQITLIPSVRPSDKKSKGEQKAHRHGDQIPSRLSAFDAVADPLEVAVFAYGAQRRVLLESFFALHLRGSLIRATCEATGRVRTHLSVRFAD